MKKTASILALFLWLCFALNSSLAQGKGNLYMRTSMFGSSLNISWIYLGTDGVIVQNPIAGANPIDLAKEKAKNAAHTGTYKMQGNKILINWSNGKKAEWQIDKEGAKITGIDGGIVTQPASMPAGYKLEGRFSASAVTANLSSANTFLFKKDGAFDLKRSGAVSTSGGGAISKDQKSGKYTITGNTLTLKFADGTVEKSLINIMNISGSKYLIINSGRFPLDK